MKLMPVLANARLLFEHLTNQGAELTSALTIVRQWSMECFIRVGQLLSDPG